MASDPPGLFIAPSEPRPLRDLGTTHLVTERNGVDILWAVSGTERNGLWGIQRKEVNDLLASSRDGRLAKELAQMASLEQAILVVEGSIQWTAERTMMGVWSDVHQHQFHGMLWSVRSRGVWVEYTSNLTMTMDLVRWLRDWSRKERHSGMRGRPKPDGYSNWGKVSDREWGIHLLSGMEGIGIGLAAAIFDHFGTVPIRWSVGVDELLAVPGVGKKRAAMLMSVLADNENDDSRDDHAKA